MHELRHTLPEDKLALDYIFLILCIILLGIYSRTKNFDSPIGVLLFSFGIGMLIVKLQQPSMFLFAMDRFVFSGAAAILLTVAVSAYLFYRYKKINTSIGYFLLLLLLYIIFGLLQQLLFQFIFLETVYSITNSVVLSVLLSAFFYYLFHINIKALGEFAIGTFFLGLGWSLIYILFGNIIWLGISHGILGSLYYAMAYKENIIERRLKFLSNQVHRA